jgi:hypothetical protein
MACPDCTTSNLPQCGDSPRLVCLRSATDVTPTAAWVQAVCVEEEVTGYVFYADEAGTEEIVGASYADVIPCPSDMRGISCEGSIKVDLCAASMEQITSDIEAQTTAINANLDAEFLALNQSIADLNLNYSYVNTYNVDDTIATSTRTIGAVSQVKTYTYDSGNLVAVSAWI